MLIFLTLNSSIFLGSHVQNYQTCPLIRKKKKKNYSDQRAAVPWRMLSSGCNYACCDFSLSTFSVQFSPQSTFSMQFYPLTISFCTLLVPLSLNQPNSILPLLITSTLIIHIPNSFTLGLKFLFSFTLILQNFENFKLVSEISKNRI